MSNDVEASPAHSALRDRVYNQYVSARHLSLAPSSLSSDSPRAPYLTKLIRNHFPANRDATVLDLGCGHGALVYAAQQAGYHNVTGVDRSPEQVVLAAQLGVVGVRLGDVAESLRAASAGSCDAIVTFDVIEHLTRSELLLLVDEVHRVLKPGGRWIIHAPNGESPFFGRILFGDITHEQAFTRISIAQLLLSSRFQRVSCYEDSPVVHGARSMVRWCLWKAFRGVLRLYLAAETGDIGQDAIFSRNFLTVGIK